MLYSLIFQNVYFEHLLYSAALAVVVGMIFSHYTGRDPSWIIIAVAFVPDMSRVIEKILKTFAVVPPIEISHAGMHNIFWLILFSLLIAGILKNFRIRFFDALFCSALGIAAHFFEDALVYNEAYPFFWPITQQNFGIGIKVETPDIFWIADSTVLAVGIILLTGALVIRTYVEGPNWWRTFLQGGTESQDS